MRAQGVGSCAGRCPPAEQPGGSTIRSLWVNLPRRTGLCPERHKVPELGPASTAHCDTREELTIAMARTRSRAGCLGWLAVSGRLASVLVHVIGMAWARQLGAIFSDHHRTGRVRRLCSVIGKGGAACYSTRRAGPSVTLGRATPPKLPRSGHDLHCPVPTARRATAAEDSRGTDHASPQAR